jgi:hypothetical protein
VLPVLTEVMEMMEHLVVREIPALLGALADLGQQGRWARRGR